MGEAESLAAGIDELAFQRLLGRKGDGMKEQMQAAEFFADRSVNIRDVFIFGDVAGDQKRLCAERAGEFLDVILQPLALVSEGQARARLVPGLGDGPGDGAFVGHAKDDSEFTRKC